MAWVKEIYLESIQSISKIKLQTMTKNQIICCADSHRYKSGEERRVLAYFISAALCPDRAVNSCFICLFLRWHLQMTVTQRLLSGTNILCKYCKSTFLAQRSFVLVSCFVCSNPKLRWTFGQREKMKSAFDLARECVDIPNVFLVKNKTKTLVLRNQACGHHVFFLVHIA